MDFIHNRIGILACTFPIGKKQIQSSCFADEADEGMTKKKV